jgi:iron complex outermembrane receptor protein
MRVGSSLFALAVTLAGIPAAGQAAAAAADEVSSATDQGSANEDSAGLVDIVVTAQKRAENVQDVPIAISAFTASALQERAVTNVSSLSNISPNITLDASTPFSGSSSALSAFIRGIGANDFAFNIDPGVGVYLDGVYLARSVGANQDLPDVERVEVLKGPQGTLFGRNTIGGAISIVTHDPGDEFRFKGDVTIGRYNLMQARGTVDIPITESLSSSASFSIKHRNGYHKRIPFPGADQFASTPITSFLADGYENAGLGREGGEDSWNLRGKLKWDDGGPVRVTLSADYSNDDSDQVPSTLLATVPVVFAGAYNCAIEGQVVFGGLATCSGQTFPYFGPPSGAYAGRIGGLQTINDLPSIFGVNADADPSNNRLPYDNRFLTNNIDTSYATGNNYAKTKSYGGQGTIEFDLSDDITLKSITAYRELHWHSGMDLDGSPLNFLHVSFEMNQWQFSQELQLLGKALDNRLNYVLGAYYFKEAGNLHDYVTFDEGLLQVDGPNDLSTKNYAFFGQIDFKPIDQIGITIGGRYTHEDKQFEGFQSDRNGLTYKILNFLGVPPCADISSGISEGCRIAAGFFNPGEPLRLYPAGLNKKKFNNFSPKVGLQYHPNDDVMLYASWSKGYKTGGWTTRLQSPEAEAPGFEEEKATTWEAGIKSTLIDRRLQINAAAFTTRYSGIQLNFQLGASPTIQNAGTARIKGFEVEVQAAPVDGLTVTGSVGYLDAKYTDVEGPAVVSPSALQEGVFVGAALPKTPKWKFNISPRYEADLGGAKLILLADYTHSTSLRNDTEGTFLLQRPATDILNGSITLKPKDANWDLTLGMTNITDERYIVNGQAQIAGGMIYGTYSRPREWYAKLGLSF